jgi:hypothetical protein
MSDTFPLNPDEFPHDARIQWVDARQDWELMDGSGVEWWWDDDKNCWFEPVSHSYPHFSPTTATATSGRFRLSSRACCLPFYGSILNSPYTLPHRSHAWSYPTRLTKLKLPLA